MRAAGEEPRLEWVSVLLVYNLRTDKAFADAGVMVWEFPDAAADWIREVRSLAFPE